MGSCELTAGESTSDDVTCIALKRRLLLCGTYTGALLVFAADQEDTDSVSRHSGLERDWAVTQPLLKMKISNEPIVRVELGFTHGGSVLCYYKTYTEDLCCITLQSELSTLVQ